ncbi:MAG: DsbA family protein [Pseudomonadota bacterium]
MARRLGRRAVIVAGLTAGAIGWTELVWPKLAALIAPDLAFAPIPTAPGFRRMTRSGSTSNGLGDPFVGVTIPSSGKPQPVAIPGRINAPCDALFGPARPKRVPIAVFTDFNCPYCRVLDARLFELAGARANEVSLKVHQLPLLGQESVWAARGALAAGQQDAYIPFHKRLMTAAFAIDPDYLRLVARNLSLDEDQLMQDALGPEVDQEIAISQLLAQRLGVFGTPGLVVGRTLALGNISDNTLDQLIAIEAAETTDLPCRALS